VLKKWLMPFSYGLTVIGLFVLMAVNTTLVGAYAASLAIGIGFGLTHPYIMSHVMAITPPKLIPVSMSLFAGGMNLGMFVAPFVLNALSGLLGGGIGNTLLVSIAFASVSTVIAVFLFPLAKQPKAGAQPPDAA